MSAKTPRVSVVIPTYNYGRYVIEAVESVLNQTFQDLELIVVDDGSTDNTRERLASFRRRLRYIYQENRGLPAARNTGILVASGEYVAFLDSDDVWLPDKLALQIPLLDFRREVGMVYADVLKLDDETQTTTTTHTPHPSGRILDRLILGNFIPTPTPVVRRSILNRVGLFDETLTACEDWDMWIRIAKVSHVECVDRPLAKYRFHSSNMHRNYERMRLNHLAVLRKVFADCHLPRDVRKLQSLAYTNVYAYFGILSYYRADYQSARSDLLRALKSTPQLLFNREVASCFFISIFGPRGARKIRASKRRASELWEFARAWRRDQC